MFRHFSPDVLYEDNHLLVVNKRAGMLVQGDKTGDKPLVEHLKDYIKIKYNKPNKVFLGIPHRIDRPVSGVVVFARTTKALTRLNQAFKDKKNKKTYFAVVKNKPPEIEGSLTHYLLKDQIKNKSKAYLTPPKNKNAKESKLKYYWLAESDNYHLLKIEPLTGRHHQIRAQLAAIRCPIKGDIKYGFARTNKDASIHLHAQAMELIHPVKKEPLIITAPPPIQDAIWKFFVSMME